MSLDVRVLDDEGNDVDLKQKFEEDDDIGLNIPEYTEEIGDAASTDDEFVDSGYGLQDENGEDIEDGFVGEDDFADEEI